MDTPGCAGGCGEEYGACGCCVDGKDKAHFEVRRRPRTTTGETVDASPAKPFAPSSIAPVR